MAPPRSENETTGAGCLASLGVGLLTVLLYHGGTYLAGYELKGLGLILVQVLFVAAPLFLLTLAGVTARLPWLVGTGLTVVIWGYALLDALRVEGGANIGLGFLMLASPFVIAGSALAVAKLTGTLPD